MLEKNLQKIILQEAKKQNILAVKIDSTSTRGWPDLIALLPNGETLYLELKTPAGRLSKLQQYVHSKIAKQKGKIYVVRSLEQFRAIVADALNPRPTKSH